MSYGYVILNISDVASAAGYGTATPIGTSESRSRTSNAEFVKLDTNKTGYIEKTEVRSDAGPAIGAGTRVCAYSAYLRMAFSMLS